MVRAQARWRGFSAGDGARLLLCVGGVWAGSFALLSLVVPQLLQSTSDEAIGLALAQQAAQLQGEPTPTPLRRTLRIWTGDSPPPQTTAAFGSQAQRVLKTINTQNKRLSGQLRRDPPSRSHWFGGYWLAVRRSSDPASTLWVYASPDTALPWLWPAIRIGSLLLGWSSGVALFLQWQLQRPMRQVLQQLPEIPSGSLELVPEQGMAAMRELCVRINRVIEQLNQQQESRRRFLRGLAHDLGSPLARLSMRMERLEDQPGHSPELDAALPQLREEINRLITLTHLLQDAAGEQGELFRPRLSAIDELCERVVASYPQQAIQLEVPRKLVRIDSSLIERALQNLIDNAISYGRPPIRLSAHQHKTTVVLQVEDSGDGLSSANLLGMPRIAPAHDRGQQKRSGLGLTIVDRCCRLHGGRLALHRSALGGLQAELHLPLG